MVPSKSVTSQSPPQATRQVAPPSYAGVTGWRAAKAAEVAASARAAAASFERFMSTPFLSWISPIRRVRVRPEGTTCYYARPAESFPSRWRGREDRRR